MFNYSKEEFIRKIKEYIVKCGRSEGSAKIYAGKINDLFELGYTVEELCKNADKLYKDYSEQGVLYDPADHNNTRSAIRYVERFARKNLLAKTLHIDFDKGYSSFVPLDTYVANYTICSDIITVGFAKGFSPAESVTGKFSLSELHELYSLMETAKRRNLFGKSGNLFETIHGAEYTYTVEYDGVGGIYGGNIFSDDPEADDLRVRYNALIESVTDSLKP